ncbi:hypothetical protein FQA39_LY12677 [Lamprigera yunnana]|nr:hypothetical protein FQA39_LY12677 [Lamprigera yunnana]
MAVLSEKFHPLIMPVQKNFNTLAVSVPKSFVYHVELNRPEALNAQTREMWMELKQCFNELSVEPDCRVIIISAAGRMFTAGLDFKSSLEWSQKVSEVDDIARKAKLLKELIVTGQDGFTAFENCSKPVLSAVHNACIGAGVSLISATDIRYCTKDAWFQVKEIILGMACDVGALQRLPKVCGGDGLVREICYTGRKFNAEEAVKMGFVTRMYDDKETMMAGVMKIAEEIAAHSPVGMQGTKASLVYSRDHTVTDSLNLIAVHNQGMLQSEDFVTGLTALATKEKNPIYSKL